MSAPTICRECGGKILSPEVDLHICETCSDPVTLPRYLLKLAVDDMLSLRYRLAEDDISKNRDLRGSMTLRIEAIKHILKTT